MRLEDIKFKAKSLIDGSWVEGSLVVTPIETFIEWYEDAKWNKEKVIPSTVCQYTGLKDKEGKEIWEHDLLKISDNMHPREVIFEEGAFIYWSDAINIYAYKGVCELINVGSKFDKEDKG